MCLWFPDKGNGFWVKMCYMILNSAANQNEVESDLKKAFVNPWNTNMQSKSPIFRLEIVTKSLARAIRIA